MSVQALYEAGFRSSIRASRLRCPTGFWRSVDGSWMKGNGLVIPAGETLRILTTFIPDLKYVPFHDAINAVSDILKELSKISKQAEDDNKTKS